MFDIDTDTPLIIYACTDRNQALAELLSAAGYNPVAFFDRRAKEIRSFAGLPVFTAEGSPFSQGEKERLVVMICMQSLVQHETVADTLLRIGYRRLVGLIPAKFVPEGAQGYMYDIYNSLLIGDYSNLKGVPECFLEWPRDASFTPRSIGNWTIWVPVERCYSISRDDFISYHPDAPAWQIERLSASFSRTISDLPLYDGLFDWLETGTGDIESYLDAFAGDGHQSRENLKSDRRQLYSRFCEEFVNGISFFEHSPATAKSDGHGGYIITDGIHRCIFLLRKGCNRLPVYLTQAKK